MVKLLLAMLDPMWVPVRVPAASFLMQYLGDMPSTAAEDGPSAWVLIPT